MGTTMLPAQLLARNDVELNMVCVRERLFVRASAANCMRQISYLCQMARAQKLPNILLGTYRVGAGKMAEHHKSNERPRGAIIPIAYGGQLSRRVPALKRKKHPGNMQKDEQACDDSVNVEK